MKKNLLISLLLITVFNAKATVLTVSNNPNSPGQYTTIAAAITAAAVNDTIYIHASETSYGNFTMGKKLTLIGAGWDGRFYQFGQLRSEVGAVTLANVNPNNPSGSKIMGLYCGSINSTTTTPYVLNVTIERCYINGSVNVNGLSTTNSNWIIKNSIIENALSISTSSNTISNCFLYSISTTAGTSFNSFSNNIVWRSGFSGILQNLNNAIVSNNIFLNTGSSLQAITNAGTGNTYNNNIFFGFTGAIPQGSNSGSNNQINVSPQFINGPPVPSSLLLSTAPNYNWDLQTSSPGNNAGTDGTDIGIFGGASPFNVFAITGITTLPQITQMNISNSTIPVNGTLNVNVIAKKRN